MNFAFAWEQPAALIGAAAVLIAAFAVVLVVARASIGPSHHEILALCLLAVIGIWTWNTRLALAKHFFPDATGVVEESIAEHILTYGDCAAYVAGTGEGQDDGAVCTLRVFSAHGRYVGPLQPPASPEPTCEPSTEPEIRLWTFTTGSVRDWCDR